MLEGCRFLAAEDNELNAEILCELLEMQGASCDVVENGKLAVEAFRAAEPGKYAAILMDVQMPVMGGYEAAPKLRNCVLTANTIGANRWWLELFVLAQGFADMYINGDPSSEIQALNTGEARLRDYMRPGLEYLQLLFDRGYIDYKTAYTYEAMDEAPKFLAQETPIVMSYQGAAAPERNYGGRISGWRSSAYPAAWDRCPCCPSRAPASRRTRPTGKTRWPSLSRC